MGSAGALYLQRRCRRCGRKNHCRHRSEVTVSEVQAQAGRVRDLERAVAHCPECRGMGWVKPDIADPADPRFGGLSPAQCVAMQSASSANCV